MKLRINTKRILCLALTLGIAVQLVACNNSAPVEEEGVVIAPMEKEEVHSYSFDFIGGKDVMPISGYWGPTDRAYSYNGNDKPDQITDEFMKLIKESGINMIGYSQVDYYSYPHRAIKLLELGEKYNLGIAVLDSRLTGSNAKTMTAKDVDACVKDYAHYPAYIGNYVTDEPQYEELLYTEGSGRLISDYANVYQKLAELGFYAVGNLYPVQVGSDEGYQKYVDAYLSSCNVPVLSYDMYPFTDGNNYKNADIYFKNLTFIRDGAEKYDVPFWVFIQAGHNWNDGGNRFDTTSYYPSRGAFYWNIGTSLAFGAKGIQYFPLCMPEWYSYAQTEMHDFQRNSLLSPYGAKTRWYYYAQDMNAQIAAVDEVLMNAVNKGVIVTTDTARQHLRYAKDYLMEGTSWRELKDVDGDAMIGCFNYNGKTALYVVNYDIEYAQNITLDFAGNYKVTVIQDAKTSHVSGKDLKLTLSAGNSALVVFD